MKEKMLKQFAFSEKVKEEIIRLVLYQGQPAKVVTKNYGLPNVQSLPTGLGSIKRSWKKVL